MNNQMRREKLLEILREEASPITGVELSKRLKVTRQIIVGDVALLRSAGRPILSTARGYMLEGAMGQKGCNKAIACQGKKMEQEELQDEMDAVVDNGGVIHSLILDTPIYGELCIPLNIHSRRDVRRYLEKVKETGNPFITVVTGGYHLLSIETHSRDEMDAIEEYLDNLGLLAPLPAEEEEREAETLE